MAFATITASGCLSLENEPYYGDELIQVNRPPVIIPAFVQPLSGHVTLSNTPGCVAQFSIRVEDPNVDDPITARWYIDYDKDTHSQPDSRVFEFTNNGRAVRDESATFTQQLDSPGNPLSVPGVHLVDVLVADAPVVNRDPSTGSNETAPSFPVHTWVVTTTTNPSDCAP